MTDPPWTFFDYGARRRGDACCGNAEGIARDGLAAGDRIKVESIWRIAPVVVLVIGHKCICILWHGTGKRKCSPLPVGIN